MLQILSSPAYQARNKKDAFFIAFGWAHEQGMGS